MVEKIDNYYALKNLGLLTEEEMGSIQVFDAKLDEEYRVITDAIKDYGTIFMEKKDYSDKSKEVARRIRDRSVRQEKIFIEIENVKNFIKRIPEVSELIAKQTAAEFKYAAATQKINLFPFENIECYGYKVIIRALKYRITITIEKEGEPYSGRFGFLVKNNTLEDKVYFDIKNGYGEYMMAREEDVIKNEKTGIYILID